MFNKCIEFIGSNLRKCFSLERFDAFSFIGPYSFNMRKVDTDRNQHGTDYLQLKGA